MGGFIDATWKGRHRNPCHAEAQRTVYHVALDHLTGLAVNTETTPAVRAVASLNLSELGDYLRTMGERTQEPEQRAITCTGRAR